jgi:peptidoglycan/LPS O-acetylase OafA/YrhL
LIDRGPQNAAPALFRDAGTLRFRADIEGLRGVAVLLVVLAHAGVPGFAGGFIGVDVFFVISGYLITGLLVDELAATGRVDYWSFYARRARRLVPAMVLMIVVVGALILPAGVPRAQFDSGFWAALWLSNLHFAWSDFGYFGAGAEDSLFLHTWSLGVEEQFYLVWPLLLVLLWRHPGWHLRGLLLVVAVSFGIGLWLIHADAVAAYYLMPSRLWQLGVGGIAFVHVRAFPPRHRLGAAAAGIAGLVALALALAVIDRETTYPGLAALLPTVGTALILAAGHGAGPTSAPAGRLLSTSALRLVGRVSYSWYLWHWPALMLLPVLADGTPSPVQKAALVVASLVLAGLSYAFVEVPFRRDKMAAPRRVVALSLATLAMLAALLWLAAGIAARDPDAGEPLTFGQRVAAQATMPEIYRRKGCDLYYRSAELVPCPVDVPGAGADAGTILLIGDSVGTQWLPALQGVAGRRGLQLTVLTKSGCPIVDEPVWNERIRRRYTECEEWRRHALEYAARTRPVLVVIGSSANYPFSGAQWTDGTRRVLLPLAALGAPIAVLAPTPVLDFHALRCVLDRGDDKTGRLVADACRMVLPDASRDAVSPALQAAADGLDHASIVTVEDLVCPDRVCAAVVDGRLVFRDEQHVTATHIATLAAELDRRLPPTAQAER